MTTASHVYRQIQDSIKIPSNQFDRFMVEFIVPKFLDKATLQIDVSSEIFQLHPLFKHASYDTIVKTFEERGFLVGWNGPDKFTFQIPPQEE